MKERPIIFSATMVRAILEGRKTQTRRVVKFPLTSASDGVKRRIFTENNVQEINNLLSKRQRYPLMRGFCPYGQQGDRLWVRETWSQHPDYEGHHAIYRANAGSEYDTNRWRPSIHMPRWASRITLEIVSVRAERLNEISDEDAAAEGFDQSWLDVHHMQATGGTWYAKPTSWFRPLWESINGVGSWQQNPWVWVVEFKRVEGL